MKINLCKLGIHNWEYHNPQWRFCTRCGRNEAFPLLDFGWVEWKDAPKIDGWSGEREKDRTDER